MDTYYLLQTVKKTFWFFDKMDIKFLLVKTLIFIQLYPQIFKEKIQRTLLCFY